MAQKPRARTTLAADVGLVPQPSVTLVPGGLMLSGLFGYQAHKKGMCIHTGKMFVYIKTVFFFKKNHVYDVILHRKTKKK